MRSHFGNPNALSTIADAIPLYGAGEFESPTRSTVPLLSLLIHAHETFEKILAALGMPACPDLFLEYAVPPQRGQGNPSYTDVMLTSGSRAVAIEAKWTEPLSETVSMWLRKGKKPANREAVLMGWLELLNRRCGSPLDLDRFQDVNYQMIHRAASAAATGTEPGLVYLQFTGSGVKQATTAAQVLQKLGEFWDRLGRPEALPFSVLKVEIQATPAYRDHLKLKKGDPATSEKVIAALRGSSPLFEFTPQLIGPINEDIHP